MTHSEMYAQVAINIQLILTIHQRRAPLQRPKKVGKYLKSVGLSGIYDLHTKISISTKSRQQQQQQQCGTQYKRMFGTKVNISLKTK